MGMLNDFFAHSDFMPHGMCFMWRADLLVLHVASDLLIVLAYFSIPGALLYFLHKRKDIRFRKVFVLFAAFILFCGLTHLMGVITLWYPVYAVSGLVKLVTAVASVATAVMLWPLLPELLNLPSPMQLEAANARLTEEIDYRRAIQANICLLYTSPSPRDLSTSRMPSSA